MVTLASVAESLFLIAHRQIQLSFGDKMGNGSGVGRRQALDLREHEGDRTGELHCIRHKLPIFCGYHRQRALRRTLQRA